MKRLVALAALAPVLALVAGLPRAGGPRRAGSHPAEQRGYGGQAEYFTSAGPRRIVDLPAFCRSGVSRPAQPGGRPASLTTAAECWGGTA